MSVDIFDMASDALQKLFGVKDTVVISEAPGAGPEAADAETRKVLGMTPGAFAPEKHGVIGSLIVRGNNRDGYGGHGDAILTDEQEDTDIRAAIADHIALAKSKRIRDVRPSGRFRMGKWFWLEGHSDQTVGPVMGAFSLFDGTIVAPSAGNSLVPVPIVFPPTSVSPVILLDRYPGMLYMSLYLRSFSFVPTATTMTGLQECWFTDITGSVAGLGVYNASLAAGQNYQNIGTQLSGPLNDPGNAQIGTLWVNNIAIAGTPVTVRYQLSIGFMAFFPDPWFNEQMAIPPSPAEVNEGLRSMGANAT